MSPFDPAVAILMLSCKDARMIRRAVFWSFSAQIASFVIQFGSSVIIARLLSPIELGVFAVAAAIMGIVQIISAFSVGTYVIREENLSLQTLDSAFTVNALISVALSLSIFASSFAGALMFDERNVASVLRLLALTPLFGIFAFAPSIMLQRAMQMRGVALLGALQVALTAAVTIGSALGGASSMSPAYGGLAGAIFNAVGTLAIGRRHFRMRLSLREWRPITAFGLRLMSIGGISSAATRVSDLILGHLLGLAALGLYSRANNLNYTLFSNVYGGATRVVFAKLSDARREGDRVTEVYLHGFRVITAVMSPLLLGLAVLSRPVVHLLYGDRWLGAAMPLAMLLLGQFVSLGFAMNWELFVLRDELKTQTRLEFMRSLLATAAQSAGAMFSLAAAAASSIFTNIISFGIYHKHMPRLAKAPPSAFYRAYGETALLGGVAALPAFLLMIANDWAADTSLMAVFASVLFGMLLWLWTIVRMDHPALKEINIVLSKLTGGRVRFGQPV